MKNNLLFFLIISIFISSCSQLDNTPLTDNKDFNSFITSVESIGTKTSLVSGENSFSLVWDSNDKISVSDGKTVAVFTKDNSASKGDVFKQSGTDNFDFSASNFVAFYPSSINVNSMVLPSEQQYYKDNVRNYPMYAVSSNNKLEFHNLCGILNISASTTAVDPVKISQIQVSAEAPLSGGFQVDGNTAKMTEKENKGIILKCAEAAEVSNANSTVFNVVLPVGTFNPLYLKFITSDGTVKNLKSSKAVNIYRSTVTKVNLQLTSDSFYPELEGLSIVDEDVNFTDR